MKNVILAFLIISTVSFAKDDKLGKEISLKNKTAISTILKSPEKFEGKQVLVEGKILDVCQEAGCWIELAGNKDDEKIKVKVNDGEIVFPKDSKGKTALIEGVLEEVKNDKCTENEMKEEKHKNNEEKDSCCSKETKKTYQIKGLGAVIK
ncbi:MAG: DUF4920 domain-containing protein [Stygiobacter sp.]